jgi:hypothetical protein
MDFGEIWSKIKEFFGDVIDYFKHFKRQLPYKFGELVYAVVMLIVAIVKHIG